MTADPACGTMVDETHPGDAAVYRNRRYFFCSAECRAAFVRNPEGYLKDGCPDPDPPPGFDDAPAAR